MLGFTRDETFRPLGSIGSVADYEAAVRRNFPQTADALIKAYAAADLASAQRAATDMGRDASVGLSMFNWASAQREFGKAPAFASVSVSYTHLDVYKRQTGRWQRRACPRARLPLCTN